MSEKLSTDVLFKLLIDIRNKINHNGWLIIPPPVCPNDTSIRVKIEWYIDGKCFHFEETFKSSSFVEDVFDNLYSVQLLEGFIDDANQYINEVIQSGESNA